MNRRIAIWALIIFFLGVFGIWGLSLRRTIAPVDPPRPDSFSTVLVARGEVLAAEGHCASCHIRAGGPPFAGGYGVNTPFGVIYGPNITPDPETGIGKWSYEAFERAMREGVSRDGSHLFPAFPYTAYTKLSDDDVKALYAYLMTRPAVTAAVPANTLPFPLSIRAFQVTWKLLFFHSGRFQKDSSKSEEWNRGAYLAEAVADCSGCHTTRNFLGAEEIHHAYDGYEVDGWIAPALNAANPSPIPWTEREVFQFLRTGVTALHGATAGTMTDAIRGSLALPVVPDSDVRAIAVYVAGMDHASSRESSIAAVANEALATSEDATRQGHDPDADLYVSACISCHYNSSPAPLPARPELSLNSALSLPEPRNFIHAVLEGVGSTRGAPGLVMPEYASALSDAEIARLAAYLRRTRTKCPPWKDLESKVSKIRRESTTKVTDQGAPRL